MKNIEPTYVSFEQAKFLKEKGFDEECSYSYKEVEPVILYQHYDKKYNNSFKKEWQNTVRKNSHMDNAVINRYSAPEQWQVCEWLRIEKGIWVTLYPYDEFREDIFSFLIVKRNGNIKDKYPYMSPQEAYSAAFDYILTNNLI